MAIGDKIGDKIRAQRKRAGLTQRQLAEKLGITQAAIGQFENSNANPKIETLQKIAKALEISLRDLLTVEENGEKLIDLTSFSTEEQLNIAIKEILEGNSKVKVSDKIVDIPSDNLEQLFHKDTNGKTTIAAYADQLISLTDSEFKLILLLELLNSDGHAKALEQIEMLTKIPEYRRE